MKNRHIIFFIIMNLAMILPLGLSPEPVAVFENLHAETGGVSPALPERSEMNLVIFITASPEEGFTFSLALYDDPGTRWEVDYMELYDEEGELFLISWIDQYGIKRLAVDRGLLEQETSELQGVLVFLPQGTPL